MSNFERYESEKRKLKAKNLAPAEYEQAIRALAEELEI